MPARILASLLFPTLTHPIDASCVSGLVVSTDGRQLARVIHTGLYVWEITRPGSPPRSFETSLGGVSRADPGWFVHGIGGWLSHLDSELAELPAIEMIVPTPQTLSSNALLFSVLRVEPATDGDTWLVVGSESSNHRWGESLAIGWSSRSAGPRWVRKGVITARLSYDGRTAAILFKGGRVEVVDMLSGATCGCPVDGSARGACPLDRRPWVVASIEERREGGDAHRLVLAGEGAPLPFAGSDGRLDPRLAPLVAPDQSVCVTASGRTLHVWDIEPRTLRESLTFDAPISSYDFTPQGTLLVGEEEGQIRVVVLDPAPALPRPQPGAGAAITPVRSGLAIAEEDARAKLAAMLERLHACGLLRAFDQAGFERLVRQAHGKLLGMSATYLDEVLVAAHGEGPTASALAEQVVTVPFRRRPEAIQAAWEALVALTALDVPAPAIEATSLVCGADTIDCRYGYGPLAFWFDTRLEEAGRAERLMIHATGGEWATFVLRGLDAESEERLDGLLFGFPYE
ncbi:hypothetical protein A7982_13802 [Minicystis rosea]|nr:hypothetical protein A7982_13802 [Minicystis rosea]